jgi:predicted nucleic acid binding AN1-type Zn finger protein
MVERCFCCKVRTGLMAFECLFCKSKFCAHHRLPEDHKCINMELAKNKHKEINKKKLEEESVKETKLIGI